MEWIKESVSLKHTYLMLCLSTFLQKQWEFCVEGEASMCSVGLISIK